MTMQALLEDWQIATIIKNTERLQAWRKKMRCVNAVREMDGECDGYRDLRNFQFRWKWQWLNAYRLKAQRWIDQHRSAHDSDQGDRSN